MIVALVKMGVARGGVAEGNRSPDVEMQRRLAECRSLFNNGMEARAAG